MIVITKTEAEKWAEFDAMMARRVAFEQRPWGAKDYVLAFLYWALVIGMSWGVIAVVVAVGAVLAFG